MTRAILLSLLVAAPGAVAGQTVSVGAGAALLTTTLTFQGDPGGGVLGGAAQEEVLLSHRAGARADIAWYGGSAFGGLHGLWHFIGYRGKVDPYPFGGVTLQLLSGGAATNQNRTGATAGAGASIHPSRGPTGVPAGVRLYHFFEPGSGAADLAQFNLGVRYLRR